MFGRKNKCEKCHYLKLLEDVLKEREELIKDKSRYYRHAETILNKYNQLVTIYKQVDAENKELKKKKVFVFR